MAWFNKVVVAGHEGERDTFRHQTVCTFWVPFAAHTYVKKDSIEISLGKFVPSHLDRVRNSRNPVTCLPAHFVDH